MSGWNGSDLRGKTPVQPKVTAKKPSPWRISTDPKGHLRSKPLGWCLIAGAIVVFLAAGGAYFLLCKPAAQVSDDDLTAKRQIKEQRPAQVKKPSTPTDSAASKVSPKTSAKTGERQAEVATEATDVAVTNADSTAEDKKPKDTRVFKNAMDQLLSMVAPREAGDSIPPVPIDDNMVFSEEDEKKILERLTAGENDSDALLERKELVQSMRDEYQEMKKRGWTFVDYIKALEAKAKLDTEVLQESQKIHDTIFDDPAITDKEYQETLEKINKVLGDRGIKPIKPPSDEEENEQQPEQGQGESQK